MNRSIQILRGSALALLALGPLGCTVTAEPVRVATPVVVDSSPTVGYAEVEAAPVEVDLGTYPQSYYGGHAVYLYRDRWYYRDGGRWAYYERDPPALYRRRSYVQQAPPARRAVERAPDTRRYYRRPAAAPPVVR